MTRAHSMDVVNDATTLESRIDAVLAAPIMEWDHSPEIQWQPGDPIWKHPEDRYMEIIDYSSPVLETPHGWYNSRPDRGGGNCPRYMFEIVGLDDFFTGTDEDGNAEYEAYFSHDDTMDGTEYLVDCEDCLVGIGDEETNCWNCGKRVKMVSRSESAREWCRKQREITEEMTRRFWGEMQLPESLMPRRGVPIFLTGTTFDGESPMRGYQTGPAVLDEWFEMITPNDVITYDPYHLITPRQYGRTEWLNNWLQLHVSLQEGLGIWRQPDEFEVPRIDLHNTNPDLYRPGYERYFESENNHVSQRPSRNRRLGRDGTT